MPYSLYDGSIAVASDVLDSLENVLKKGEKHANSSSFPTARIHPDMNDLAFQVHIVTLFSAQLATTLAGSPDPSSSFPGDNLATFSDFYSAISKSRSIVSSVDRKTVDSREAELVDSPYGKTDGKGYTNGWGVPNIYFHLTTVYNILRKEGVDLGKKDYLVPIFEGYEKK